MAHQNENSVTRALSEILHLEADRVHLESAKREAAESARVAAASEAARRETARKAAQARIKAEQHRIREEMAARDEESAKRIAALKAELEAVRRSREAIHGEIQSVGLNRADGVGTPLRGRSWMWALLVVAACGLGLLLGRMSGRSGQAESKTATLGVASTPSESSSNVQSVIRQGSSAVPQPDEVVKPTAVEVASERTPKPGKTRPVAVRAKKRPKWKRPAETDKKPSQKKDDLGFFDKCGSDPMCGFDKREKK